MEDYMIAVSIITSIIALINWIALATFTNQLLVAKGYSFNIILAILFGILYLIYAAGLPKKENTTEDSKEHVTLCKQCGFQVFDDEDVCSNCGAKIDRESDNDNTAKVNKKEK